MSDETAAAVSSTRRDWGMEHRERYLRSGGADGHIEDLTPVGGRDFGTHCLIKYVGRKSGKVFITGLTYADIGGEVVVCGSKGGADTHPEWYLNVVASETVEFQIATKLSERPGESPPEQSGKRYGRSSWTAIPSMKAIKLRPSAFFPSL